MFLVAIIGFGALAWRMASAFEQRSQVIVMDETAFYLPRTLDFASAKALHEAQIYAAVETLFDRGPNGIDHEEKLKRLFDKRAYEEAIKGFQSDAAEFHTKDIHQKVEIEATRILQVSDDAVLASFEGQLIRSGIFDGKPFVQSLLVHGQFNFSRNPSIIANGAYPTVVRSFEITIEPLPKP
jgi:hypothetical protein